MNSKHAPAERASRKKLEKDLEFFKNIDNVKEVLNALPYIAAILNKERQIVYSNDSLLSLLNVNSLEELLGHRPGEAVNCLHSSDETAGCGTSEACKYCGAVNTILECQKTKLKSKNECRITANINGKEVNFDFLVTATPFYINKAQYIILSLNDISAEKRRKALERIFFHDVINTSGSLNGIIELMKDVDDANQLKKFLHLAERASKDLLDEIIAQKELVAAENNELKSNPVPVFSDDLIKDVVMQIIHHPESKEKSVIINRGSNSLTFTTDVTILKRVLINMLKNAIEATPAHEKVKIGCLSNDHTVTLYVNNPGEMLKNVQLQVFMRSFSTKGYNRGLGTYSMKLLTEKYLKGIVYFETDKKNGTTFFVKLPL